MWRTIPSVGCGPLIVLATQFVLQTARSVEEEMPTCESDLLQSMPDGVRRFLQAASKPSTDKFRSEVKAFAVSGQPKGAVGGKVAASLGLDTSAEVIARGAGPDRVNSVFDGDGTLHHVGSPSELEAVNDWGASNDTLPDDGILDNRTNEPLLDDPLHTLLKKPGKGQLVSGKKKKGYEKNDKFVTGKSRKTKTEKLPKTTEIGATAANMIIFLAGCAFGGVCFPRDWLWGPEAAKAKQEIQYGKLVVGQLCWKKDKLEKKWTKGFVTDLEPHVRVTVSADPNDLSVKNGTGVGWDQVRPIMSPDEMQPTDA